MKTRIIFWGNKSYPDMNDYKKWVEKQSSLEMVYPQNVQHLVTLVKESSSYLFFFGFEEQSELEFLLKIFKQSPKQSSTSQKKLISLTPKHNTKYDKTLRKVGCYDFIDYKVHSKSLAYKTQIWLRSMNLECNGPETKEQESGYKYVKALNLQEDFWINDISSKPKKFLNKWIIKLQGPSINHGTWTKDKDDLWSFEVDDTLKSSYGVKNHTWIFKGQKPEFDWKTKTWSFTAEEPQLFIRSEALVHYKIKIKESTLLMTDNTTLTDQTAQLIENSYKSKLYLEKEAFQKDHTKKNFENDNMLTSFMKGNDEGTQKMGGHLSLALEDGSSCDITKDDHELKLMQENPVVMAKVIHQNMTYLCEMTDLFENEITLKTTQSFSVEGEYHITVSLSYQGATVTVNSKAKLIENDDELVSFELESVLPEQTQRLMSVYNERQEKIHDFLKLAKGY